MSFFVETLVVGGGLAGASAALGLARTGQSVALIDENGFASGASGSGAGLVSPMMSRKGRPVWKAREALDALGLPETGLLRPASSPEQAAYFEQSTDQSPDLGVWMNAEAAAKAFPYCRAPFGLVRVLRGCSVDLADLTKSWIHESASHGAILGEHVGLVSWRSDDAGVRVLLSSGEEWNVGRVVLATGPGLIDHPETQDLNLHPIKGQRIRVKKPADWYDHMLPLSGSGFVLDEGKSLSIGATFEHEWTESGPTDEGRRELIELASHMVPEIAEMEVIEHTSGIRITVPGTRMPMIGPLPAHPDIWVFTGLGSKGILMSALLGMKIPQFFNDISLIPASCRVANRKSKA